MSITETAHHDFLTEIEAHEVQGMSTPILPTECETETEDQRIRRIHDALQRGEKIDIWHETPSVLASIIYLQLGEIAYLERERAA